MAQIRFKPEAIERVRRERFWGLVEEKAENKGIAVTLLDCSLEWLAGWVLSFGSMAEVLSPERLKELVANEAEKVAAKYMVVRPLASSVARSAFRRIATQDRSDGRRRALQ
jgi:predicted DNA-binding transcriptional regulator YafY